ncbi:hypothetical protein BCR35DRAFT_335018 [Leucosporidium creatinivorum]|uniref:TauD/TfdA-like domain-containing protein n=1 Tax=Leucosporidium creatinivorum TaxID=106004 RepID=A0A1Y2DMA9_9BASI|nr:hypothetical protein BCR35DRAFT_335018 [Leucosporidium creatinivorum]
MPTATLPTVTPVEHPEWSECGVGAEVQGIDLASLSDDEFKLLEDALYKYKVLIVKPPSSGDRLSPVEQFDLVCRFDPTAKREHGHGDPKQSAAEFKGKKTLLEKPGIPPIPIQPEVRLIGHGPQEARWGLEEGLVLSQVSHTMWHKDPLSAEEMLAGFTRWNRWHIDASFMKRAPPIVTTLHALKVPQGSELTLRWDDGSGKEMKIQAGTTAFLDGAKIYSLLSPEQKLMVENSKVVYAPHPFRKHAACRGRSNGLGQVSEGLEAPLEDLPPWEDADVLTYPMLWTSKTGEKAFQVHSIAAWKLLVKTSPDAEEQVIDDIEEVRRIIYELQRPALEPKFIFAPPYTEGDCVIFYNRGLMHCATEYPLKTHGPRTMHQAHVAGSSHPV